jgi:hypothetical protein
MTDPAAKIIADMIADSEAIEVDAATPDSAALEPSGAGPAP